MKHNQWSLSFINGWSMLLLSQFSNGYKLPSVIGIWSSLQYKEGLLSPFSNPLLVLGIPCLTVILACIGLDLECICVFIVNVFSMQSIYSIIAQTCHQDPISTVGCVHQLHSKGLIVLSSGISIWSRG